jgi:ATP sulfurylase
MNTFDKLYEGGKRKNISQDTIDSFIHQLLLIPDSVRRQEVVDEIFSAIKTENENRFWAQHPELKPKEELKENITFDTAIIKEND